jgi:ribose transport system permease protein
MTVAIIFGTFDLSVGAMLALCAWVTVSLACQLSVPVAVLAGLGTGLLVGLINGVLVSYVRIPAFIATLGMMYIVGGFNYVLTQGGALARCNKPDFIWMGNGFISAIPVPFVVMVVCALAGAALLNLTPFGRYVYAGGSNPRAAQVAGVPMRRVTLLVFMVVGLFTAISAVLLGARLYSAGPGLEPGFELRVIATVVLGGTPLSGGRGSLLGTVAAAILFATLANVLNLIHADSFLQYVVIGLVLLVAVSIEGVRQRVAERLSRQ